MCTDDVVINGDLAFRVYYTKGFLSNTALLLERLIEHRPFPWSSRAFYIAIYIIYLMLFVGLVQLIVLTLF
jgi:hypothetical protein